MFTRLARILMLVALLAIPASAQAPLGPGEGKPIIYPDLEIATTIPLLMFDTHSQTLASFLYPLFIGRSPDTGELQPGVPGSLATGWEFNEDGTVLTVHLRDDWTWSDGTPITSADIQYPYEAVASGEMDSPLNTALSPIRSLETPDAHTVVLTFAEVDCAALDVAEVIPVVPAHHYREIFPTFPDINTESPYNLNPQVTAGPFKFANYRAGEQITLLADQNYPDSPAGYVVPEGIILKFVTDGLVAYEHFLNGKLTVMGLPPTQVADAHTRAAAGEFKLHEVVGDGYLILFFNMGDPANPQPGVDENGNRIEQAPHPILGDLNVRRAIAHAIDFAALNEGAFEGTRIPVGGAMLPHSWAYNENIQPYPFDPELSMRLLDEAGWTDHDGDAETPRVATEAVGTVAAGTPLELELMTNADVSERSSAAILLQDQLQRVGIGVRLEIIDFNVMVDRAIAQTYDMFIVGSVFNQSQPHTMDETHGFAGDVPGLGANVTSYYNPELEETMAEARTLPGCVQAERKTLYDRAQEIIHDDVPYYIIGTSIGTLVVHNSVENFDPKPFGIFWNIAALSVR